MVEILLNDIIWWIIKIIIVIGVGRYWYLRRKAKSSNSPTVLKPDSSANLESN